MESTDPAVADTVLQAVAEALRDVTGRIVIGYSGGLDSTVLLWAVSRILPAERILAAHVNHNAQAASSAWVRHCREFSEGLRIAFLAHDLQLSGRGNFEALARDQRHAWLRSLLQAHDVLLLAHHQDDQAETALLRILQGRGTYGMPMARTAGAGELRRPLLRIPHRTLVEVALREGLRWVHDPTNDEPSRDRAFVRGRVLALLRTRWPEVSRDLAAIGERSLAMEGAGRFLAGQLPDPLPLSRLPEDASAAIEIVRWWILARGGGQPGRSVLERWYADGAQRAARRTFVPLSKGRLIAEGGLLYFQPTPGPSP